MKPKLNSTIHVATRSSGLPGAPLRYLRSGARRGNNLVALHIQVEVQQDQVGLERHGELRGLFAGQSFLHLEIG